MKNIFPTTLALGAAFCNREQERKRLLYNIEHLIHTLIVSPRRYGKTSLVAEVVRANALNWAEINLFNVFSDEDVVTRVAGGIAELIGQILTPGEKALRAVSKIFKYAKVNLEIFNLKVKFQITPSVRDASIAIKQLFGDLEVFLKNKNIKAVIFLDEFQDIVNSSGTDKIQALLREFVQKTKQLTFVVSGSHRHMLLQLFEDRNKPFYKMFFTMPLYRISEEHYQPFIQAHAKQRWGKALTEDAVRQIFYFTQCHPYYTNKLCDLLWFEDQAPSFDDVCQRWQIMVREGFSLVAGEITNLTRNQRVVLQMLAEQDFVDSPNHTAFVGATKLAPSSILFALDSLMKQDFVERLEQGYRVIDPLLKYILQKQITY